MNTILIISTGGTFNKVYNSKEGTLDIDINSKSIIQIQQKWMSSYKFINIIGKDSLEFTNSDREELLNVILKSNYKKIVVIHGTDTIDLSAEFINKSLDDKAIVFTGAMVPFSIDKIEATANLSMALGAIKFINSGVYISMNGEILPYNKIIKNRELGVFTK